MMPQIISGELLPSIIDSPEREAYMGRIACSLYLRLATMPQPTLVWRLEEWLSKGCSTLSDERIKNIICRTLVVVGDEDKVLPSTSEAARLTDLMLNCAVHVVAGAGHSATCGSRTDLAAIMRGRFTELQGAGLRTRMKEEAAASTGVELGMVRRGHKALSPLQYWNQEYMVNSGG